MKVGICSLGCKVNIYESELVTNILKKAIELAKQQMTTYQPKNLFIPGLSFKFLKQSPSSC